MREKTGHKEKGKLGREAETNRERMKEREKERQILLMGQVR